MPPTECSAFTAHDDPYDRCGAPSRIDSYFKVDAQIPGRAPAMTACLSAVVSLRSHHILLQVGLPMLLPQILEPVMSVRLRDDLSCSATAHSLVLALADVQWSMGRHH